MNAGSTLYVEVGGNGVIGPTFNGGGAGGDDSSGLPDVISQSGGGASDVRTVSMTSCNACNATLNSRLVVAGGGGGSTEDYAGGNAGAAGLPLLSGGGAVGGGALGVGSAGATAVGGVCVGGRGADEDGGGGGGGGGALGGGGGGVCDGGGGGTSGFIGGASDTSISVIAGATPSVTITTGPQPTPAHVYLQPDIEGVYTVPSGVTEVHISAVGGFGGFSGGSPGGASDTAQADLKVKPGQKLYVEVATDGTFETGLMGTAAGGGGWPDGGNGGPGSPTRFGGAGGGGDSDVRTVSLPDTCVLCTKSYKSRVVVAAGGGGASYFFAGGAAEQNGEPSIGGGAAGGGGLGFGDPGTSGSGSLADASNGGGGGGGGVNGGGGGGPGAGGGGGTSGFSGATINRSITVTPVTAIHHPSVTIVPDVTLTVAHAGKGAGVVSAAPTHCGAQCALPEPPGKIVTLTATPRLGSVFVGWSGFTDWFPGDGCGTKPKCTFTMDNSITITATYRFKRRPQTRFGTIDTEGRSASFHFTSSGVATHFQCALTTHSHRVRWHACTSPKRYTHLKNATYTFRVRAVGPQGPDRSPAKHVFTVT